MGRFNGKRILITGGTAGIGLAGAKRIAEEGGEVVITGLNPERLAEAKNTLPSCSHVVKNDACDPRAADDLAASVKQLGALDGLWLNAGFAAVRSVYETDADFFDRMMNTNVRGPILQMARLSSLLNTGASVVLTSSTAAYEGSALASVYAATKGAMISLARCWTSALAPQSIRVNAIVPGAIGTNFRDFMPEDLRARFEADVIGRTPLRRVGSPEEAAAVALFLLSDDAAFVTGSQYAVDGGLAML
ncbi:SDR family oxidoreductase [Mesorhizobium sp. B2-4-8]|uniref:SDR family oxidoreductase n=1 Tax=Mesorhizobium sp. B2-4-8 TaxID=2589941 RepID=UPI00112651BF|nr:SDR family oxidoreductase [Mesorhizobium sp. B2-4-8]TPL35534.1 SDR family oxidoreductase [Mesorhizobium sp. B2-4-8]